MRIDFTGAAMTVRAGLSVYLVVIYLALECLLNRHIITLKTVPTIMTLSHNNPYHYARHINKMLLSQKIHYKCCLISNSWVAGRCGYTTLVLSPDQVEITVHTPGCAPTEMKQDKDGQ